MRLSVVFLTAALLASPAAAQVEVQPLAAPDFFSQGSRDTGLPSDLWRGTSPAVAADVIPTLGRKPLTPAARDLAWRLMATSAIGPDRVGRDPDVAAARIQALLALGRPREAWMAASRAMNLPGSPALAEAVAETALVVGEDDRACAIADGLSGGRGEIYWLRLRAYCQARAGQTDAAQLTLTLASEKQRDPVVSRLIGAVIAGAGDPGAASVRNGLEYSLSRRLALDIPAAKGASPAVAAMIAGPAPSAAPAAGAFAARFTQQGGRDAELAVLFSNASGAAVRQEAVAWQGAVLLAVALGAQPTPDQRAAMARFEVAPGAAAAGRLAALDLAAEGGLKGEAALLALAIASGADGKPLKPADAARVVAALRRVGLTSAAEAFADETYVTLGLQ